MIEKEYLASRVSMANEAQLVALVYEGLIESLKDAIGYIQSKEAGRLNHSINKSREIIAELLATLQGNSTIAQDLKRLYIYINQLITEAEMKKDESKLATAIKVVTPLYEAWQQLGEQEGAKGEVASTRGPAIVAGMTYGRNQLNDYVMNDEDRWKKG